MSNTMLFETDADLIYPFDTARTRLTDPLQSHLAGDRSQRNRSATALGVLTLVWEHPRCGSELNELFRAAVTERGWVKVAWDSPRKRAGELCEDGYFDVVDEDLAHPATERVFQITAAGVDLMRELAK